MRLDKEQLRKPTKEEEKKEEEEKFYFTRALLVTKQLAKSQARTRREVRQKWKVRVIWTCPFKTTKQFNIFKFARNI